MLDLEPTGAGDSVAAPSTTSTTSAATTPAKKTATKAVKKAPAKKAATKAAKKAPATTATATASDEAAEPAAKKSATKSAKKATSQAAKKSTAKRAAAAPSAIQTPDAGAPVKKAATKKSTAKKATAAKASDVAEPVVAPDGDVQSPKPARKRVSRKAAPAVPAFDAPGLDDDTTEAVAPAATAPPVVLFQPPVDQAPTTRTRRRAPAAKVADPSAPDGAEAAADELDATATDEPAEDTEGADSERDGGSRRRRRRGGRGRRSRGAEGDEGRETEASVDGADTAERDGAATDDEGAEGDATDDGEGSTRRRRRSRRRGEGSERPERSADDESGRSSGRSRGGRSEEPTGIKGSVRIEAKRQRRREGREAGRRRPPVLTEAEFLARRESVDRVMVVRQVADRTQIGVLEDGVLVEHHVSRETTGSMIGNVYLGRVQNVLPSMEAAFVDIGRGRNAVLYAGEVNWDAAGLEGQPKRIEVALKSGDAVLVQVTKDPVGHKGARLTSQISLPGRYLVFVPDGSMTGISRKLPDTERSRLKGILKRVLPENAGVIVRTASEGASEEELSRDVSRLSAQWEDIQAKAATASPATLLYGEPDLTIRVIRDIFNEDFNKVVVSGGEAWETVDAYVGHVAPDLHDRLERWTSERDVWSEFRIDEQLMKALDRKVWLPSGGSLVIDRTEAMTVVDVNTGKFTGQGGNLEQTVTENNLEAAEEIVRQLRLRDIGGIIVIDFIDMVLESNRELVLRRLLECLGRDRTKHQVAEVTSLGLVQMTRKRVGQGLLEVFSTNCESCNGRGIHVHMEPVDDRKRSKSEASESGGRERDRGGKDAKSGKGADRGSNRAGGKSKAGQGSDDGAPIDAQVSADQDLGADSSDRAAAPAPGAEASLAADPTAESGTGEGRRGRRSRGRRGGASTSAASTTAPTSGSTSGSDSATDSDAAAPAPAVVPEPAAVVVMPERAAPVLAPRGVDPVPSAEAAPKRRRRAASRPAGAPEGGSGAS